MAQKFNAPFGSGGKTVSKPMAKSPAGSAIATEEGHNPQEQDGAAVAAEHGPAVAVNLEHEHEIGVHHVHSSHADGHEHHSDHASAEEAHEHGKKLAGLGASTDKADTAEESSEPWERG
jgi:hypothetical protein